MEIRKLRNQDVLVSVSHAGINYHAKTTWEGKDLFSLHLHHSPSLKEVRQELKQRPWGNTACRLAQLALVTASRDLPRWHHSHLISQDCDLNTSLQTSLMKAFSQLGISLPGYM